MDSNRLFVLSGIALFSGGLAASLGWIGFTIFDPGHTRFAAATWWLFNGFVIAGGVLMVMGLPGWYAYQARQAGLLGLIGFIILFVGIATGYIAVQSIETASMSSVPTSMMRFAAVGAPAAFVGAILTGIAVWRAGVFPRWLAVSLIVSVLLGLLSRLVPMPLWLERSLISTAFTGTLALFGFVLMRS